MPALIRINRIYISGPHGLPAAMTACQKKRNYNDPKDKAPRVATTGLQPVGIAYAKLRGGPPARQPHLTLIKDFLNLSFSCRCSQTPEGDLGQPPGGQLVAAEPD